MYYIFLETRDDDNAFFFRIAQKNCLLIADKIKNDYKVFIQQERGLVDYKNLQEYLQEEGRNIKFINCYLLTGGNCINRECCTNQITVLVSDQINILVNLMQESIKEATDYLCSQGNDDEHELVRVGIQTMRQTYMQIEKLGVEKIEIPNRYSKRHAKYWPLYIRQAKRYANRKDLQGFCYVRVDNANSDYIKFKNDTGFTNINPCDTIRGVV
jgi:hypothetical protein